MFVCSWDLPFSRGERLEILNHIERLFTYFFENSDVLFCLIDGSDIYFYLKKRMDFNFVFPLTLYCIMKTVLVGI